MYGCALTYFYSQEADSKDFKAQLKTKDEEAHQAKKDYETQLAKLEEKSSLLGELNSKLAEMINVLEATHSDEVSECKEDCKVCAFVVGHIHK